MSQNDPGLFPPPMPPPLAALQYSVPTRAGRPGIVTAIGVLSIVVACFSGFASLITGFYGFAFWMTTRASVSTPAAVVVNSNAAPGSPRSTLTEDQIVQVLNSAVRLSPATLTDPQIAALRAELSKPNQQLVRQTANPAASFVNNMGGQTSATIGFDSGNALIIDPQGHVSVSGPTPMQSDTRGWIGGMVMGEAGGSLALAIYLLVVGILVFRSRPSVPRLLAAYAVLKISLALLAGIGLAMLGSQLADQMNGGAGGSLSNVFLAWSILTALLGCAFPIGLLIALHARTVKDYFGSVVT